MAATSTKSRMGAQVFTIFPELPIEIRLKIWDEGAKIEPRIVEICLKPEEGGMSYDQRNTISPFYSPTSLPALFRVNRESRTVALTHYPLSFPNAHHPAQIRFNASIDTLFFPAWCFQYNIHDFEMATSEEEKGKVERMAFETLVWYADFSEGVINNQVQISDFRGLKELILVQRLPDEMGCGCCHEFEGVEEGVVGFAEIAETEEQKREDGEVRDTEAGEGGLESDEEGEVETAVVRRSMVDECGEEFKRIKERDPLWMIPEVKQVDLMRNGVLI